MKMIGISVRSTTRFWTSSPLRSGRATSNTKQFGTQTRGRARNAAADAKVSGCQPAQRISNSSDSRTETSSSTTNTMGVSCDIADALLQCMALPQGARAWRIAQRTRRAAWSASSSAVSLEGLAQARHGTLCEHAGTDGLVGVCGDEDDRHRVPATRQFPLELGAGHARQPLSDAFSLHHPSRQDRRIAESSMRDIGRHRCPWAEAPHTSRPGRTGIEALTIASSLWKAVQGSHCAAWQGAAMAVRGGLAERLWLAR